MSPRVAAPHVGQRRRREVVRADGVGAEEPLQLVGVGVGRPLAPAGDAGVVHEDVDATELGDAVPTIAGVASASSTGAGTAIGPPAERLDLGRPPSAASSALRR